MDPLDENDPLSPNFQKFPCATPQITTARSSSESVVGNKFFASILDAKKYIQDLFHVAEPRCNDRVDFQVKNIYDASTVSPVKRLQDTLVTLLPQGDRQPLHWTQNPERLRELSLLRNSSPPPVDSIDLSLLNTLFGVTSQCETLEDLRRLFAYVHRLYPAAPFIELLQEAIVFEERLQEKIIHGKQEGLLELATEVADRTRALSAGGEFLLMGGVLGRAPDVQGIGCDLLNQNSSELVHRFLHEMSVELKKQGLLEEDTVGKLEDLLNDKAVEALCPQFAKSLLDDRFFGQKILLAPVEFLRCRLAEAFDELVQSLVKDFIEDLGKENGAALRLAAKEGRLAIFLQEELEQFLHTQVDFIRRSLINHIARLTGMLPPCTPNLMRYMDVGDLGAADQSILVNIQKQKNGRITLSLYAGGAATHLQPATLREEEPAYQMLVQYCDLTPEQVDREFFYSLLSYRATYGYSVEDFYDGLLRSLGAQAVDLHKRPEAYSIYGAANGGHWGALYAFFHQRFGLETMAEEEDFLFHLQRQALLDAFHALPQEPVLRTYAEQLVERARVRFERGKKTDKDLAELASVYATVQEILGELRNHRVVLREKKTIIPDEIAFHMQALLSHIPLRTAERIKDLLIGALGEELEETIDFIVRELPPTPSAPSVERFFIGKTESIAKKALWICLGLTPKDFTSPTYGTYIRVALLVAQVVALIFCFPLGVVPIGMRLIETVALPVLARVGSYFFPEQMHMLHRKKDRVLGGFFARLLLSKTALAHFHELLFHVRAFAMRAETISYQLDSVSQAQPIRTIEPLLVAGPVKNLADIVQQPALLLCAREQVTAENLHGCIDKWLAMAADQEPGNAARFLNDRMKLLPVPAPIGELDGFWEPNRYGIDIEKVSTLLYALYKSVTAYGQRELTEEMRSQLKVNFYKGYAIIDRLARQDSRARLEGFTANGWALATWNKELTFRLYDRLSREQLEALHHYFGVDPNQDALLDYKDPKIVGAMHNCLFFTTEEGVFSSHPTERYLDQFLNDPQTQEKMAKRGIRLSDPYTDRLGLLYHDSTGELLPRSFHFLHQANIFANHFMQERIGGKPVVLESLHAPLVRIQEQENFLRPVVNWLPSIGQSIEKTLFTRYIFHTAVGVESVWTPLWKNETPVYDNEQISIRGKYENLSKMVTNFYHFPPQQQNEILNNSPTFLTLQREKGWILENLLGGFAPKLENILSSLPRNQRNLLAMASSNPAEQAARTLAYFSLQIDELRDAEYRFLFRALLLQGDLLYPYLQKHPEFAEVLGDFFKRALYHFSGEKDREIYLDLIEIAILVRAVSPDCNRYFPDFREELLRRPHRTAEETHLLLLPWFFVDPLEATQQQIAEATLDIILSWNHLAQEEWIARDLLWKWKPTLQSALDDSEILRSSIFNRVAVSHGKIDAGMHLIWEGSFPQYYCGDIIIDLGDQLFVHSDHATAIAIINEHLGEIFEEKLPEVLPLQRGCYRIPSQGMGVELRQKGGQKGYAFLFFKELQGEKFYWTQSAAEGDLNCTYWVNEANQLLLTLDKQGNVQEKYTLSPQGQWARFYLHPEKIVIEGEECERIELLEESRGLSPLSWFQPLSTIRAYRSLETQREVRRIEFTALQLVFNVSTQGEAIGESGVVSGLTIAKRQQQWDRCPELRYHTRYLLLENSEGLKVLLPSDTLYSAAFSWILNRTTSIQTSHFMNRSLDPLFTHMADADHRPRVHLFDISERGRLTSNDPEAMLHLLGCHLAQHSIIDLRQDLQQLEALGKWQPFSKEFLDLSVKLQLAALGMSDPEITRIVVRLGAITEENRMTRQHAQIDNALLGWIALQCNYYTDLIQGTQSAHFPLDEQQELFILKGIAEYSKQMIGLEGAGDSLELTKYLSIDKIAEALLMHPRLAQRFRELKAKWHLQEDGATIQSCTSALVSAALPILNDSGTTSPLLCRLVTFLIDRKSLLKYGPQLVALLDVNLQASWEEIPLQASAIQESDWIRYMHLYYQLAVGCDTGNGSQFQLRRKELLRTLNLLKGAKYSNRQVDIWLNVLRLASSPSRMKPFPSANRLVECLAALQRSKLEASSQERKYIESEASTFLYDLSQSCDWAFSVEGLVHLFSEGGGIPVKRASSLQAHQRLLQMQNRNRVLEEPLSATLSAQILAEDRTLAEGFRELLDVYFALQLQQLQQSEIPDFELDSDDSLIRARGQRLNTSIRDYYTHVREKQRRERYLLRTLSGLSRLSGELKEMKRSLEEFSKALERDILLFAQKTREFGKTDEALLMEQIMEIHNAETPIYEDVYFQELLHAFGRGDLNWFQQHTKITEDEKGELEGKLYRYLIYATRLQQLDRMIAICEKAQRGTDQEILFEQLGFEMTRSRAYDFEKTPDRFLRGYLLFEYGTKFMLWEKQVAQIQKMLQSQNAEVLIELLTGFGKTVFGIPMIGYYATQMVYNCFPASLVSGNIAQISKTSQNAFGQAANAVEISRSKAMTETNLWALRLVHLRALVQGEHFNGRKKDLQALELLFLEEAVNYWKYGKKNSERVFEYMKLLAHIRTKVRGNVDEAHRLFQRNEELNHPLGVKKRVKDEFVETIIKCVNQLAGEIQGNLKSIHPERYNAFLKRPVAQKMARYFNIPGTEFEDYLCGELGEIPQNVYTHPQKEEIGLTVGLLNQILPEALSAEIFVDYGPSKKGNGEYAFLYSGNETPIENATIKNPFEAVLKTCIMFLRTGLHDDQLEQFAVTLRALADKRSRIFMGWTNGQFTLEQFSPDDPHWHEICSQIRNNPATILDYVRLSVIPEITYFTENLRSDSYNFASMFSSFYADTATPSRDGTLPHNTQVLWDPGTTGNFIDFLSNHCATAGSIKTINNNDPQGSLQEILHTQFLDPEKRASALIDTGALFQGLSNRLVAKQILEFIKRHRQPECKGVVFFDDDQELVMWEIGASEPIPFKRSSLSPAERISYLDHVHTFGADLKHPIGSKGVLTIGDNTLEEITQGGGRMRGLRTEEQGLILIVREDLKQQIVGDRELTIRDIVTFAQKNEAQIQGPENYLAARGKIANISRRAILDAMILATDVSQAMHIFKEFQDVLITKASESPFELWGSPEVPLEPERALSNYKEAQYGQIRSKLALSRVQQKQIEEELDQITRQKDSYPPLVSSALKADLGIAQEVMQGEEIEQEQEVEQQLTLQVQQNLQFGVEDFGRLYPKSALWKKRDYFADTSWLIGQKFDSRTSFLPPNLKSVLYPVAATPISSAHAFKSRLRWSNNFLGIDEQGHVLSPLSPLRKPVSELLIVREAKPDGTIHITSVAIDDAEVKMWRHQLAQNRQQSNSNPNIQIALFNIELQMVTDSGKDPLNAEDLFRHPDFCLDLVRWKFLAGHTNLTKHKHNDTDKKLLRIGKEWIETHGISAMKTLFEEIHQLYGIEKYQDSDMECLLLQELFT